MLTALLGAYGGYQRGRDTAYQRALEQQQATQGQESIDIERQRAAAEQQYQTGELGVSKAQLAAQNRANDLDANGNPLPPMVLPPRAAYSHRVRLSS